LKFDLITVDGDHSAEGATKDLEDVIPYLSVGGVLVFDDISHPQHRYLLDVWKSVISKHNNLTDYCFTEIGYGVAFAIKT
jgi:predicted O-methyltransferase YrrM